MTDKDVVAAKKKLKEVRKKVKETIDPPDIGPIKRPTQAEIKKRGTVLEQTEQAMEESLDKHFVQDLNRIAPKTDDIT